MRNDFESPIYRKSRVAARLILKARSGRPLSPRQRQFAASLAKDPGVLTNYAETASARSSGLTQPALSRILRVADQLAVFEGAIDARTEELMNSYGLDLLGPPLP